MKKVLIILPVLLVLNHITNAQSESTSDLSDFKRAKILKLNILSPIAETLTLAYENVLTPESSLQFTFSYISDLGFAITPEYRYYLSETPAPRGVYIAPFMRYYQLEGESIFGGGLVIGTQGLFKKKITIDGFLGPSINTVSIADEEDVVFGVRAGITVGINLVRK